MYFEVSRRFNHNRPLNWFRNLQGPLAAKWLACCSCCIRAAWENEHKCRFLKYQRSPGCSCQSCKQLLLLAAGVAQHVPPSQPAAPPDPTWPITFWSRHLLHLPVIGFPSAELVPQLVRVDEDEEEEEEGREPSLRL